MTYPDGATPGTTGATNGLATGPGIAEAEPTSPLAVTNKPHDTVKHIKFMSLRYSWRRMALIECLQAIF